MKKLIATLAVVTLLFTMSANAQEKVSKKKQKAKTEKSAASASDKKECSAGEKKGGACCAHKAEAKS